MTGAIETVRERIAAACERAGRDPSGVRLVAVTKTVPPERVAAAAAAGLEDFGENYLQELETKVPAAPAAAWHFLGRVQRNKVPRLLELGVLIQTLEPGPAAERLAALAEERGQPVPCLAQVDFAGHRVGVAPEELAGFVAWAGARPGLDLRGLMTVPPLGEPARPWFRRLRELRDGLSEALPGARELSMGMSADYEDAVEEGSTMVRVGSAIFGPRPQGPRR
jgi:hypothetical protein